MTERIKFDNSIDTRKMYELVEQGYQLTCPTCNSDLEVALSLEEAREKKLRSGVFCPKNENHVTVLLEFADTHRKMHKLFDEMQTKWEKEQTQTIRE